jgi:dUTP pyrophosphatase
MIIKFKKNNSEIKTPKYALDGDAGIDLYAYKIIKSDNNSIVYDTGLSFEIREGYAGYVFPRSSIRNYNLIMANSVGLIDSNYRNTIQVSFKRTFKGMLLYRLSKLIGYYFINNQYLTGDRICQLVILPYPQIKLLEVNELSETNRGFAGHGSTGTN